MQSILKGVTTGEPEVLLLDEGFRQQVIKNGGAPAIFSADRHLTYREWDDDSSHLACLLMTNGCVRSGDRPVMLAMSPSADRFVAILALLKLKIPYLPIESSVPKNRVKIIIREAKPLCILASKELEGLVNQSDIFAEGIPIHMYSTLMKCEREKCSETLTWNKSNQKASPESIATILYTSGSTGVPKGVMLTHRNIMTRLAWQWRQFPFLGKEVGMAKTSALFVDSITEFWSFVLQGRPVVVVGKERIKNPQLLVDTLVEFQVSRLLVVPSLLNSILLYVKMSGRHRQLSNLDTVICSGEALPVQLAQNFFTTFASRTVLVNLYGSTEITGDATCDVYANIDDVKTKTIDGSMSIGKPIDNVTVRLVDDKMETVPLGQVGEIVISGPTVMKGYVNAAHGTAMGQDAAGFYYRTGDYGKLVNDVIVYQGRQDAQVKIRGNRVNMSEIEKCVSGIEGIEKVVVLLIDDINIVAFCALKIKMTETEIQQVCVQNLPDYMIPRVFLVEEIPLSESTGKVDRVKLKETYANCTIDSSENLPPQLDEVDELSRQLLSIIAREIGVHRVKLQDNFYELGGNSINVVNVAAKLDALGFGVNFQGFLQAKTIDDMKESLTKTKQENLCSNDSFEIRLLDESAPRHEITKIIAETFTTKETMTKLCKAEFDDMVLMFDHCYDVAMKSKTSGYILRKTTQEFVGTVISMDAESMPDLRKLNIGPAARLLLEVLEKAEEPAVRVPVKGRTLEMFASSVKPSLSVNDNLLVIFKGEQFSVERAREMGFAAVRSVNTSPVTKNIALQLGYDVVGSLRMKDYVRPDGTMPFLDAHNDAEIFAMIKML